jgi:hypothetical protein
MHWAILYGNASKNIFFNATRSLMIMKQDWKTNNMAVFHAVCLNSLFRNAKLLRIKISVFWAKMPCSPVDIYKLCKNSFMYLCLGHWITLCKPWFLRNWDIKQFLKKAFVLAFVHARYVSVYVPGQKHRMWFDSDHYKGLLFFKPQILK